MLVEKRAQLGRPFGWLDDSHMDWLTSQPATLRYRDDVLLCHGSPRSDETYWLDRVTGDGLVAPAPIEDIEKEAAGVGRLAHPLRPYPPSRASSDCATAGLPSMRGASGCPGIVGQSPWRTWWRPGHPMPATPSWSARTGVWHATIRYVPYDNMRWRSSRRGMGNPVWASALATGWVR